jgi:hypothetical protein
MGFYDPIKKMLRSEGDVVEPLYKKILAGGFSGMLGSSIANPTDLLKVRFQAQAPSQSIGLLATAQNIWNAEGLKGLYRGVVPTTQRAMILTATQIPVYEHSKKLLLDSGYFKEGILTHFVSSMISGWFCATTTSPVDVVKSRLMNQPIGNNGKGLIYSSTGDCFTKIIQTEGIRGLYKGWLPNWLRIGPHTVVTFIILEQLRRLSGLNPV